MMVLAPEVFLGGPMGSVEIDPGRAGGQGPRCVASQIDDPRSTLSLHRALLDLRRRHLELTVGDLVVLEDNSDNVLSFARSLEGQSTYVAINFTDEEKSHTFPIVVGKLLGTRMARVGTFRRITLDPNEAVIAAQTIGGSSIHNSKPTERHRCCPRTR